jgi:cyclopropane-fatty-acyl-phospholipid synthase
MGLATRWMRGALFSRLERLHHGRLTVSDLDGEVRTFGSGEGLRASIQVTNPGFYQDVILGGALGVAESYLKGWWECGDLTSLFRLFLRNLELTDGLESGLARIGLAAASRIHSLRRNTLDGSKENIRAHYDLGNDFFRLFLDETMSYSAGIFERADSSLYDASVAKIDRLCRKLDLKAADHLMEIGTGWGALAIHAARHYGCRVTTTTISREQYEYARERVREAGVSDRVELLLEDYRNLRGSYDKLVSVEMIEAVGREFMETYLAKCCSLLKPEGAAAIQAILIADNRYDQYCKRVDFIQRYVFPGSHIPSMRSITTAMADSTDFTLAHLEDITQHYARTLREWRGRFFGSLDRVRELGYPGVFVRLWDFYLCYCEAGFEERNILDVQMVLARPRNRPELRFAV